MASASLPGEPAARENGAANGPRAGDVNGHTHLYSGLVPLGMPAPRRAPTDFVDLLGLVWWRLDRALDEASLRAAARLYVAEALLEGTTTLVDHHESPAFIEGSLDVLAEEADALGARLFVTYGATERNGGREEARRGLRECERFIREQKFAHVRGMVGLHASFTVGDETIRDAGALARELGVPVHVHVAEAESDVADAQRRGYGGPLERLIALGCLPRGSVVAHGVWLDAESVGRAHDAGAWLVQNPRSNAHNRVGYPHALQASSRVALGTDGFPANLRDERRALHEQAAKNDDPADAATLVARQDGGRRLAHSLEMSLATIDERPLRDVVEGRDGERPDRVTVAGRLVVDDGRLVHGDIDAVRAHAREHATRLWSRLNALPG